MQRWPATLMLIVPLRWISWGSLALLCACAGVPLQNEWIIVGHTTREEVIDAYGEPDLVLAVEVGETVIYRPQDVSRSAPALEVPTIQAGPRGTATTKMEPIRWPGTGAPVNGGTSRRKLERELRIRYNDQGIIQEVIR